MEVFDFRDLVGTKTCKVRKSVNLKVRETENYAMANGLIPIEAIKGYLIKGGELKTLKEVENFIKEKYSEKEYPNEIQRKKDIETTTRLVMRYLEVEKRKSEIPYKKEIDIEGDKVNVTPTLVFRSLEKDILGNEIPVVEVVVVKNNKPAITARGQKEDTNLKSNLQVYGLLKYGRELLGKKEGKVKASFYWLKKKDETATDGYSKDFDFKENSTFVSQEYYPYETPNDSTYLKSFESLKAGRTCPAAMCQSCDLNLICHYEYAPKGKDKEEIRKSLKGTSPSVQQQKAIVFDDGVARINAGAGAGKTFVVILNVIRLLMNGCPPEKILLITYTNAGCKELRDRLSLYIEDFDIDVDVNNIVINTFNGFGQDIIVRNFVELGFNREPQLISDIEKIDFMLEILKSEPEIPGLNYQYLLLTHKNFKGAIPWLLKEFDTIKSSYCNGVDDYKSITKEIVGRKESDIIYSLYLKFQEKMLENGYNDYIDQYKMVFQLLETKPFLLADMGFKHIIVDEFQDTNDTQLEIVEELMTNEYFKSLVVVGDDSQSIFGFNGTSPRNIIEFPDIIEEDVTDIYLVDNYRSTPEIISVANQINALNSTRVEKDLISVNPSGKKPILATFTKKEDELNWIAQEIKKAIDRGEKSICFIGRTKAELTKLQSILSEMDILSLADVPVPLMNNSKVLAAIELAEYIVNPSATKCLMVFLNALYDNRLLGMEDRQHQIDYNSEVFNELYFDMEEKEKKRYLLNLLSALRESNDVVYEAFFEEVSQRFECLPLQNIVSYIIKYKRYGIGSTVRLTGDYDAITLTTAHSSKGKEWDIVFNSITNYDNSSVRAEEWEELRRLIFVSFTRAKKELYVSSISEISDGTKDCPHKRVHKFCKMLKEIKGFEEV